MMQNEIKSKVEQAAKKVIEVKEVIKSKDLDILEDQNRTLEDFEDEQMMFNSNPFEDLTGFGKSSSSGPSPSMIGNPYQNIKDTAGNIKDKAGSIIKNTPNPLKTAVAGKLMNMVVQ